MRALILLQLIVCLSLPTWSQEAGEKPEHLEEMVVTSQRREEKLQEVPQSVTPIDAEYLDDHEVRTLQDLNGTVPGFVTTNSVAYGAAPLSIRGIGGANGGGNLFADEPVAIYVDGVYIGRLTFTTADLMDIEMVEVLRGPQGTLYGRNSTAGALLVRSARPTQETEGYLNLNYSDPEFSRITGAVSGPIIEGKLTGRLAVGYGDRGAWGQNPAGPDLGNSEDLTIRGILEWKPSDSSVISLILESQERDGRPATIQVADLSNPFQASPYTLRGDLDARIDDDQFALNDQNSIDASSDSLTLEGSWQLGNTDLDLVLGYRDQSFIGTQDSDGTELQLFDNNGDLESEQFSAELRLASGTDSAFSWIIGAYTLQEENSMTFDIRNHNGFFTLGTEARFDASQDLDASAFFADMSYQVNDQFSVTLGGRYSVEDKSFRNDQIVYILHGGTVPEFVPNIGGLTLPAGFTFLDPPPFEDEDDWSDFSPRAVLNYQTQGNDLLYFSYTQGFKSGGYNGFGLAPSFDQEDVNAFELGYKYDSPDRRFRLNAAAFSYDYSDLQVRLGVPTGGVEIQNAAAADIQGLELETMALLGDYWRLNANLSWLDATFKEGVLRQVPIGLEFAMGAPIPLEPVDVSGNHLSRAPEIQAYLSLGRSVILENFSLEFWASARHQDDVFFLESAQDQPTFREDAWTEMDVQLGLTPHRGSWQITLFGRNIGDERHITQVTQLGAFPSAALNDPARWGLKLDMRF